MNVFGILYLMILLTSNRFVSSIVALNMLICHISSNSVTAFSVVFVHVFLLVIITLGNCQCVPHVLSCSADSSVYYI